ncbi:MAG: hypothetical protein Q8L85_04795 [Alphaproteobacteria bacterium]|nr:hypothetical protein [Alphaproteobacteria bacterium]
MHFFLKRFALVAFFLLPWTLLASEQEAKKESDSATEEHGKDPAKEDAPAGEHGEKKPAEKEKKPSKEEAQETMLNPNRIRIQEFNISRFGANDKVIGIISLFFYIEFNERETAYKASASMPKLRSVLTTKLTEYVSNNTKDIQDKGIKKVIKNITEKLYGAKTVKEITIFKAFERKL